MLGRILAYLGIYIMVKGLRRMSPEDRAELKQWLKEQRSKIAK